MISSPYSQQPWHQVGLIVSIVCEGIHSPPPVKHAEGWQGTKMLRIFGNWGWFSTQLAIAWVSLEVEYHLLSGYYGINRIPQHLNRKPGKKKNSQHAKSGCPSFGGRRAFSSPSPSGPSQKHWWVKHISCSRRGNNHNHNHAYAYYAYHYDYDYDTTTTRLPLGDYDYDYDTTTRRL